MRKTNKITAILFALLCIPFCGAWTAAYAEEASETRYIGGNAISTYAIETINYVSKTVVEDIATPNNAPFYMPVNALENSCGATAGAIAVGFYDRYYTNMISNWDSTYVNGWYKVQDGVYVFALINNLYSLMKTNVVAPGVSEDEFKDGLKSYINGQGYSMDYQSLWSGSSFDYNSFKTAVKNNQVTALFIKPSNYYRISTSTNADSITNTNITGNHIMIAYGYYEVKYTFGNGTTRTDTYLKVSTGLATSFAYYKVGSYIDAAYILKIS